MAKVKPVKVINNSQKSKYRLEESLYKSLRTFLITSQVFCSAPANIHQVLNPLDDGLPSKCSASIILKVLHILWCGSVVVSIVTSTYYQYTEFDTVMPIIQKALYISEYISNALNVVIVTLGCYWQRRLYQDFFDRIVAVDIRLQDFRLSQGTGLIQKLFRLFLIAMTFFFSIVLVVDFLYNDMSAKGFFRSSTVYTIPNIITVLSLAQYCGLIFCIQIRYSKINTVLANQGKSDGKNNMIRKLATIQNIILTDLNGSKKDKNANLHEIINSMRSLYAELDSLTLNITSSFGVLILSVFVASFLILSIQVFALYKILEGHNMNIFLFLYTLLWIVLHTGKMLLVLSANNELIKEKSKTGVILNEIESINLETELSVNRFILQLMAQNRAPIACGVIELDMMFLGTIVGALTTYIIFLIQFDLSTVTLSATTGNMSNIFTTNVTFRPSNEKKL